MPGHVPHSTPMAPPQPWDWAMCHDAALLDTIRTLMFIGVLLILALLIWELYVYNTEAAKRERKPKAVDNEECKLHGRKLKDCPPESHQQNSDDSSSQEPPTDSDSGASDGRGESAPVSDE